jgi:fatty-acyl-CoA synthase
MPILGRGASWSILQSGRAKVQDSADRVKTAYQVGTRSGLLRALRPKGVLSLLKTLRKETRTPAEVYRIHAQNTPDKIALVDRGRSYTFRELDETADRIARGLVARGAQKGASGVLMMKNRAEFFLLQVAIARIGGAAVSVSWRSTPEELVYLVDHCGATFVFADHDVLDVVERALPNLPRVKPESVFVVGGDDPRFAPLRALEREGEPLADETENAAVVIYTSGTTGKPKGAVRKFPKETMQQALRTVALTPMRHDDIHLAVCPLYHSTAFGFSTLSFLLGATVVLLEEFRPEAFLDAVERHGITMTTLVPTMLHRILALPPEVRRRYDTSSLRTIVTCGAPLPGPIATAALDAFGDILYNFYGATETGLVTLAGPAELRKYPTTIGKAIPGNTVLLLDDDGNPVPPGQVGELFVRSPLLVEGYHKNAEATAQSQKQQAFSVGDLARMEPDGCIFIEGRKRDMIISGGVNVYPAEVEQCLEDHPGVAEAAVIGVPDNEWGERVRAFVVAKPDHPEPVDEAELRAYCKRKLAGPKNPRDFVFLETLPRNPTGKVLKRDLRDLVAPPTS